MDHFVGVFALAIPIIAIVGGISVAIVRTIAQARLEELARRERIAAIERGVDPAKLPGMPPPGADLYSHEGGDFHPYGDRRLRRAHGLLISGLILVAVGLGLGLLVFMESGEKQHWAVGFMPIFVGLALLGSSAVVWPRKA